MTLRSSILWLCLGVASLTPLGASASWGGDFRLPTSVRLLAGATAIAQALPNVGTRDESGRSIATPTNPAINSPGSTLSQVRFDQNLDGQLPLSATFRDESGREVALGDYFGSRPVVVLPVYFRCPVLCGEELKGLARTLRPMSLEPGVDFDVVAISIDPSDTPAAAAEKKAVVIDRYGRPEAAGGWHFLTGSPESIRRLAETIGFRYVEKPETQQYVHASGLVVATPKGRIARYFFGIDYSVKDLQLALLESSQGKIGSPIGRLLLLCYHYDPTTGRYTFAVVRLLRVIGSATAIILAIYVVFMIRRDRLRVSHAARLSATNPTAH